MKFLPPLAFLLLPVLALAQPSATMRPALLESFDMELSSASEGEVKQGALTFGRVSVLSFALSASGRHPLDANTSLSYGFAFRRHDLDSSTALLPGQLTELTLNLGLQRRFSGEWSAAVFARPGFYSDFEALGSSSLNLPLLALVNYTRSPELTWNFGLNVNTFSDNPVLPIAGVRWRFAPDWTFTVGFPQSGFSWQRGANLTLRAGLGFNGGSFRVTESRGVPGPGRARLANTHLDFREVRAGLGADLKLARGLVLAADLGAVTDRKFDYFDRDFRLDGDTGLYGSLALRARF